MGLKPASMALPGDAAAAHAAAARAKPARRFAIARPLAPLFARLTEEVVPFSANFGN
jgi:hypothetical protein